MTEKIGRNKPCPCGSGIKYKKCCSKKESFNFSSEDIMAHFDEITKRTIDEQSVDAIPFLSNFDNVELLKTLALLQVMPKNHGKNIRLEEIAKQAVLSNRGSSKPIKLNIIKDYICKNFPSHYAEDPPENMFTENIMTPAGNMIVFPGITEGQPHILQQLINILLDKGDVINPDFSSEVLESTILILAISDIIASSFSYQRNMLTNIDGNNEIFFPPQENIEYEKDNFIFSYEDILVISNNLGIQKYGYINDYLIDIEDEGFSSSHQDLNPLIFKPFQRVGDDYILVSPTTIVFACVNNILGKAIEYKCIDNLILHYSKRCWDNCRLVLQEMGYFELQFEFPNTNLPIYEGLFKFDSDKIAYVLFKYDNGVDYNSSLPLIPHIDERMEDRIDKHRKTIFNKITRDFKGRNISLFHVNILNGIGRPQIMSCDPQGFHLEVVALPESDLMILHKSGNCDCLTLWNFSLSSKKVQLFNPNFMDNISYFIENDESFYMSDEGGISHLVLPIGNSLKFNHEATQKYDIHFAIFSNGHKSRLMPVTREKFPVFLPIYSTREIRTLPFMVTTRVFESDLWIKPSKDIFELETEKEKYDAEICTSIAYWLNEISTDLPRLTDRTDYEGIVIEVQIIELPDADLLIHEVDKNKALEDEIFIEIHDHRISVSLNKYFFYYLYRNDNLAERILIEKILDSLNKFFIKKKIPISLNQIKIDSVLDKHIPNGQKKKLLMKVGNSDIRISPDNVKSLRPFYTFEMNRQLDDLGKLLSPKPYKHRTITSKGEKQKLINDVVTHFYNELRKMIPQYSFKDMLAKLLILNEATIQAREGYKFEFTPQIECFQHHSDIRTLLSDAKRKNLKYSISLRCLIEHIVAEPPKGDKIFGASSVDRALALMHNIISWGFLSDKLNFDIADVGVSLLPSGRIGTDKTFQTDVIKPFYDQKYIEDIKDLSDRFLQSFELPHKDAKSSKSGSPFKDSFQEELNISFDNFLEIIGICTDLAYNEEGGIYREMKEGLISRISSMLDISAMDIEKVIDKFSLNYRGRVENVSDIGYKSTDFYPWRYSRELSLLSKPLIITDDENGEFIWFGARALVDFNLYFVNRILSGRYKGKSNAMKSYIASRLHQRGGSFNKEVYDYFYDVFQGVGVYKEVKLKPNGLLSPDIDLGDIDILIINETEKKILAIECKNINVARIPYEMHLELQRFITGKKPWIPKVEKREQWLKKNLKFLEKVHKNCNLDDYSFECIFLTNEVIPLPFIKNNQIKYRFVTFYEVRENVDVLFEL